MKKTIGICLFTALLVMVFFLFCRWKMQPEKMPEKPELIVASEGTEEETSKTTESIKIQKAYRYILRGENGFLTVYEKDGKTILLETNIRLESLSEETKEMLSEGIYVQDEKELYDLLESYSS